MDPAAHFWLLEQVRIYILIPCCETNEQINVSNVNVYHIYWLSVTLLLRDKAGFDFKSLDYHTATLHYNTATQEGGRNILLLLGNGAGSKGN